MVEKIAPDDIAGSQNKINLSGFSLYENQKDSVYNENMEKLKKDISLAKMRIYKFLIEKIDSKICESGNLSAEDMNLFLSFLNDKFSN